MTDPLKLINDVPELPAQNNFAKLNSFSTQRYRSTAEVGSFSAARRGISDLTVLTGPIETWDSHSYI